MNHLRIRESKNSTHRQSRGATSRIKPPRVTIHWRPDVKVSFKSFSIFILGLLLIAVISYGGLHAFNFLNQPITEFEIEGEFTLIDKEDLLKSVQHFGPQGFININLNELKQELNHSLWIDSLAIRKEWPNKLKITIEESQPRAKWYDSHLLLSNGALVALDTVNSREMLPILTGPVESQREVLTKYLEIQDMFTSTNLIIQQLHLLPHGAWRMKLSEDIEVYLGKKEINAKIQRLLLLWNNAFTGHESKLASIDLRYSNGAAVGWKPSS